MVDKNPIDRRMTKPDTRRHIEALHTLATGSPVFYVACTERANWQGRCTKGRTVTPPDFRIHVCGLCEPRNGVRND